MLRYVSIIGLCLTLLNSCHNPLENELSSIASGLWRGELLIGSDQSIPFHFTVTQPENSRGLRFEFINAEEKIVAEDVSVNGDSIAIRMPVFNSVFYLVAKGSKKLSGVWKNLNKGEDYEIPFIASHGVKDRFLKPKNPIMDPFGQDTWEVTFSPDSENPSPAIGLFDYDQSGAVSGTFATEKGDYRFLEGLYCDSTLKLSCFDGAHAFLFKAKKTEAGDLKGHFWSGHKWKEAWYAKENKRVALNNPDSLTKLTVPAEQIAFSFKNLQGDMVSLNDKKYQDKPVIIQVLGSWCPNCADESRFYQDLYQKHGEEGLQIIGLCFESTREFDVARDRVQRFKDNLGLKYDFLIAGYANKKEATETLGFFDNVSSFPTSLFLDKNRSVKRIHTGFYGPGTGDYYTQYVNSTNALIDEMMED